jgi:hypothetical protein
MSLLLNILRRPTLSGSQANTAVGAPSISQCSTLKSPIHVLGIAALSAIAVSLLSLRCNCVEVKQNPFRKLTMNFSQLCLFASLLDSQSLG